MRMKAFVGFVLAIAPVLAPAQYISFPRAMAGCVADSATGAPLDRVSIAVKGRRQFAQTDSTGFFYLSDALGRKDTLILRRYGFATRRVPVPVTLDSIVRFADLWLVPSDERLPSYLGIPDLPKTRREYLQAQQHLTGRCRARFAAIRAPAP